MFISDVAGKMRWLSTVAPVVLSIVSLALAQRFGLEHASREPFPVADSGNLSASLVNDTQEQGSTSNNHSVDPNPEKAGRYGGGENILGENNGDHMVNNEENTSNKVNVRCNSVNNQGQNNGIVANEGVQVSRDSNCTCVEAFLCDGNFTDGTGIIDVRVKPCSTNEVLCCSVSNESATEEPAVTASIPRIPVTPGGGGGGCGRRHVNDSAVLERIMGGDEAMYGEFPWMVAVLGADSVLGRADGSVAVGYLCGGSLIHPKVVLTAAHCVNGKTNFTVRVGDWNIQTSDELYPTQDRRVRQVMVHERFYAGSLVNDPALLILEEPVDVGAQNVGLVCLPERAEVMDGRRCVSSGWGKDGWDGENQAVLRRVDLPIVAREPCVDALRQTKLGKHFKLHESFICAGGIPGRDTCKGDGGSPLVCPSRTNPDVYVQVGIVAWGVNCGSKTPGVYVSVPHFIDWIDSKLQQVGISLV